MAATISLPVRNAVTVQVPVKIGAKTIHFGVNYATCAVSVARTNTDYYTVAARTGLRGMDVVAASVYRDTKTGMWAGEYFDREVGEYCSMGMETELAPMLQAAMNNVSWRGHELGSW